jgi:hypothetical protein
MTKGSYVTGKDIREKKKGGKQPRHLDDDINHHHNSDATDADDGKEQGKRRRHLLVAHHHDDDTQQPRSGSARVTTLTDTYPSITATHGVLLPLALPSRALIRLRQAWPLTNSRSAHSASA